LGMNLSGRGATVAHGLWESPGPMRGRVVPSTHDRLSGVGTDHPAVRAHETLGPPMDQAGEGRRTAVGDRTGSLVGGGDLARGIETA
jgi:hypothetical protein